MLLKITMFLAIPFMGFTQNLCTNLPIGAVAGDFELSGNAYSGCSPFSTLAIDKSGGTDIKRKATGNDAG